MTEKQILALRLGRQKGLKRNRPSGLNYNFVKENSGRFKKGTKLWVGKHHSEVTKNKLRLVNLGKKESIETRFKKSKSLPKGINHWNWKGGITKEREKASKTIKYKLWRDAVFKRDNYTCQECKARGIYLEADHIKEWANYKELRYEISNGRTLCRDKCHKIKTISYLKGNQYAKK